MKKIRLTESDLRQTIIDSIGDDVPEHLIDRIADKIAAKLAGMTQKRNTIGPNNNSGGCGYTPAGGCGSSPTRWLGSSHTGLPCAPGR